jgi:hypothetical protein
MRASSRSAGRVVAAEMEKKQRFCRALMAKYGDPAWHRRPALRGVGEEGLLAGEPVPPG